MKERKLALGLGLFSIGLGMAELLAPHRIAKTLGMKRKQCGIFRIFGIREMATGAGILTLRKKSPWLWARVAGDVVDLATIGIAGTATRKKRRNAALAAAAVAGVTALDIFCGRRLSIRGS
ncbi:hypothetical protein [Geobacter sp. SVR]|uniref:hypothetical protein n=1 Tax=Geobacter sp. SVR TaxID=2495594 RepID=UPI00143EF799|nr:hypothetical protein [Geobacter sp. SVR]BCS54026.1 hypothetical protein GSVR_23340 [Geobacter sp. SVR]GCF86193.1 hypothetical protein GSbR_27930 [Geobacter sp. SVR]